MLPRVATTTGTVQSSLALQAGASADAAVKPQLSAAALANLRAAVLLRLIETMLKHMPHGGEPSPGRDLLDTLLVALKTPSGREGEGGRKLTELLAKLPPELRPHVEKLIGTVLSSMPTRVLVEVVRNPNGPEAQKLATLLSASFDAGAVPAVRMEGQQQQPRGLNAQQLAAVGRHGPHGPQHAAQPVQILGDARTLQAMLKRTFDFDAGSMPRPMTVRATETVFARQEFVVPNRLPVRENAATPMEPHLPTPVAKTGGHPSMDVPTTSIRQDGPAEDFSTATPAVMREEMPAKAQIANTAGQALARSVLHAVARDLPPALLMQAVEHLMGNLTPEEASFLRALLARSLEPTGEQEAGFTEVSRSNGADRTLEADRVPEDGKPRSTATQTAPALPDGMAEADGPLPMPLARDTIQAAFSDATPERLLPSAMLREGIPLAFVPNLPAEEDVEWSETREAENDEEADEDRADGDGDGESHDGAGEDAAFEASGDEPEAADMAKRREKTAELVGTVEPGLVFYQKLGDYWT